MTGQNCLSAIAVAMALLLGLARCRRFGRATIPLVLLALMAAMGSMSELNDWLTWMMIQPEHLGCSLGLHHAVLNHPLWRVWESYAPSTLAIIAIVWLLLATRRLPR